MPHIDLHNDLPGIRGLLAFSPQTAEPLGALTNLLLYSDDGLSRLERELIATHVSYLNDCFYCHNSHGEIACQYAHGDRALVEQVKKDYQHAPISDKLKALLGIAAKVQQGGKSVLPADIDLAKNNGASDKDIHDTVLIAAAFCMYNRYVDGLAATTPTDMNTYPLRAKQVADRGYGNHIFSAKDQPVAEKKK